MIALDPAATAGALRNLLGSRAQYGRVTQVARHLGVSRPTVYRLEATFLDTVCRGRGRRCKTVQEEEVDRLRARIVELEEQNAHFQAQAQEERRSFRRALARTRFWLIGLGLPARVIARLLRECFSAQANRTDILHLEKQYARRATHLMQEYFWPLAHDADLDEIFIEDFPLFMASDPRSLAILKTSKEEERTIPRWSAFLHDMPNLKRTTSDRGQAIRGAVARRGDLVCQSDIFHPKMLLRTELAMMEKHCYGLLAQEDRAQTTLEKTRARGRDSRAAAQRYRKLVQKTRLAIEQFDELEAAVHLAFDALRLTTRQGTFNSPATARESLRLAKEWIHAHLPNGWNKPKHALDDEALLTFLTELHRALPSIPVDCPTPEDRPFILVTLARLWEEQAPRRQRGKPVLIPPPIVQQLQSRCPNLTAVQSQLFNILDHLHRASSGIESINSRVGFYRYSKRRFSSDFANLIAIWHNLTPFKEGKRASQSPAQILGAKLPTHDLFALFGVE